MRTWAPGLAAVLAAVSGPVRGQSPAPPAFSTSLELVQLVVSVRDKKGLPVADLQAGDFRVRENGKPQRLRAFARAAAPGDDERLSIDIALLLDTSGSMAGDVKLSREAAVGFLDAVPRARDRFVVLFDNAVRGLHYHPSDRDVLLQTLARTPTGGGTALYDAVDVTLRSLAGPGRQVVVLVSDGDDYKSQASYDSLKRQLASRSAVVYPIAFSRGLPRASARAAQASTVLHELAALTGGEVFSPNDSRDLPAIFARILQELSSQYLLGFVSDDPHSDDRPRRLEVDLARPGLKLRYRKSYLPGKDLTPQ